MTCTSPYLGKYPCGHCTPCRIQYGRIWADRLIHELNTCYKGYNASFLTLTYDNEHLSSTSLEKRDFQLFIKRIRKFYGTGLKYFLCGEYGDKTKRKHGHAIVFGIPCEEKARRVFQQIWGKGYVYIGSVTQESCRYVTDYILKKYNGTKAKEEYGDNEPPFRLMSRGLGKAFLLQEKERILENACYFQNGIPRQLPRYYLKLLKDNMTEKEYREFMYIQYERSSERTKAKMERAAKLYGDKTMIYYENKISALNAEKHKEYMMKNRNKGVM